MIRGSLPAALLLSAFVALGPGCATLPTDYDRPESHALDNTGGTALGKMFAPRVAAHGGGMSGVYPLRSGYDALAARIGMANVAERSLDAQYYIWSGDLTGKVMLDALIRAADRGVRVRLLLDDLPAAGYDQALKAFDLHPNAEVRLFNPFAQRRFRGTEMVARFGRLNRRMHNKAYIADNQVAIVGGRNIGNEYFEAKPELDYRDFDVLAVGPVVKEVSDSFDLYWNSELAVPVSAFEREDRPTQTDLDALRQALAQHTRNATESRYGQAVRGGDFVRDASGGKLPLLWAKAHAVYDDPSKFATDPNERASHLGPQLRPYLENLRRELWVISPYFVPEQSGVDLFKQLENAGVQVHILTNSLASTDVTAVFAGYLRYRVPLLQEGVDLYELKPSAQRAERRISPLGSVGSSRGSLHAKVFIFDQRAAFVGSMNLDPRSLRLNSELGVIIESEEFARALVGIVTEKLASQAYHVELERPVDPEGPSRLVWKTVDKQGKEQTYTTDPEAGLWRRFSTWFMSIFVPEGQL